MLLMIDNYDSFTHNLVHYFEVLGQEVKTYKNNQITIDEIKSLNPQYIVLSPGPGNPSHSGICMDVLQSISKTTPTLGVCLGHQCLAKAYHGKIIHAKTIMHGKTSLVKHSDQGIFKSIQQHFKVTRYHSLAVEEDSLPESLMITAYSDDNEIMGLKHKQYPIEGVQFHPESILTEQGYPLLENFLKHYD